MAFLRKMFRKKGAFDDLEEELERGKKSSFSLGEEATLDFSSSMGIGKTKIGEDLSSPPSPLMHPFIESPLQSQAPESFTARDMQLILKNLELLSSKIDSLKANLESIGQRVENIERIALREQH